VRARAGALAGRRRSVRGRPARRARALVRGTRGARPRGDRGLRAPGDPGGHDARRRLRAPARGHRAHPRHHEPHRPGRGAERSAGVIRVWLADARGARPGTLADAHQAVRDHSANAWIDFDSEDEVTVREALAPCGVHPLVVEDLVMQVNRPKFDDYGDYLYLVVHSARWEASDDRPSLREVDMVVGDRWLVTYHEGETRSVTAATTLLPRRPSLLAKGPAYLMHYLLDVLVDHYLPLVDRLAEDVDRLEEDVFTDASSQMHVRILRIKRGIGGLRRIVGPQRDTL